MNTRGDHKFKPWVRYSRCLSSALAGRTGTDRFSLRGSTRLGANAAVAAVVVNAKLAGLWLDKTELTDPSGEKPPRNIISDRPMSEEEWIRERCGE
jgi:hypothetical protein